MPGPCKAPHIWPKSGEMFFAPTLHPMITRHRVRLLPQIKMKTLIRRQRKRTTVDIHIQFQAIHQPGCRIRDTQSHHIASRRYVTRHFQRAPYRTRRACLQSHGSSVAINHIGHKPWLKTVIMIPTGPIIVRQHIAHKAHLAMLGRDDNLSGF